MNNKMNKKLKFDNLPSQIKTQINNFLCGKITRNDLVDIFKSQDYLLDITDFCSENKISFDELFNLLNNLKLTDKNKENRRLILFGGLSTLFLTACGLKPKPFFNIENGESKIKNLFYNLNQIPELKAIRKPIYINDLVKTIIIIGDIHAGFTNYSFFYRLFYLGFDDETYSVELKQLELLKDNFNFNFVGIEGIANDNIPLLKEEIEKKSFKYNSEKILELIRDPDSDSSKINNFHKESIYTRNVLVNGEEELIKNLIRFNTYNLIGLEELNLQILDLKIFAFDYLISYLDLNKNLSLDEIKNKIFKSSFSLKLELTERSFLRRSFNFLFDNSNDFYLNNFRNIFSKFYSKIDSQIVYDFYLEMFTKYPNIYDETFRKKVYLDLRNEYAVKKMLEEMNKQKQEIGIIVFGKGHIDGLIEELNKQTNNQVNIYVAK